MDLSLPLIGVLGVIGYNINRTSTSREYTDKRVKIPLSELGQGKSIYEARKFERTAIAEKQRYEKIRKNNKLISFNSVSDLKAVGELKPNKKVRFDNVIDDKREKPVDENKIFSGPMFSVKKFFVPEEKSKEFRKEGFTDSGISDLSGKPLEKTHKNMQPFFGSKVKNGGSTGQLGRYTGEDKPKKMAVEGIRNGKQQVNGSVAFTSLVERDRFVTPDKQATLLPFEQVRVLPIRAEDNRPNYKTVDQLNVNNTKISLEGRMNGGKTIASRPLLGIVNKNTVDTFYKNDDKLYGTYSQGGDGYYKDVSQEDRTLRKNIIAETTFNQNPANATNFNEPMRVSKTGNGRNTVVQETTRHQFQNDWVRGRKTTKEYDDTVYSNIKLREQERETSNTVPLQGGFDRNNGHVSRVEENLKTTNKELTLYEYKGSFNSNGINLPSERKSYYEVQTKTKPTSSYTAGGVKKFAPGAGVKEYNYDSKNGPSVNNYIGNYKGTVEHSNDIGKISKNRLASAEHDYSDRIGRK